MEYKEKKHAEPITNKNEQINEGNDKEFKTKIQYPVKEEKETNFEIPLKRQIILDFINKDAEENELENDYKIYIKKAYDEEDQYKIIYEFNKLPYKPKISNIDLSAFDDTSIFKCISQ